ncbi:hypothetical protein [Cohaesibacter intestini]|uniref:hypothetical protein n=1 Tax=Cohaesibacter intestini TaxID=2211145 RepID=UPI0013006824|nr:hypothetical protein [Cohaesibacter intestini]
MISTKRRTPPHFERPAMLLVAGLLVSGMTLPTAAQTASPSGGAKPSLSQNQQEEQDWREPLLAELARLATALEQEQKFNQLLRNRLDILDHRIDLLEEQNSALSDQLGAMEDAPRSGGAAQTQPSDTSKDKGPTASGPMELGKSKQTDQNPPSGGDAQAKDPVEKQPPKADKDDESGLPDNFEQFLDMGEAMMRRFFGVVKEFRKEFDENRV